MQPDTQTLDEVVVIGYGTVKKRDLTGAVASVKSEDIVRMPTSNVLEAIQGQVAGLDITRSSGEAGSGVNMTLRGTRSINGDNSPLFIIDGMEGSYDELNPNDIASIEVLKMPPLQLFMVLPEQMELSSSPPKLLKKINSPLIWMPTMVGMSSPASPK